MKIMLLLLLLCAGTVSFVQAKDSDLMENLTFLTTLGINLKYLLFIPKDYDASKRYPLVVTLRATGSDYIFQVDNNDQAHPWIEDSIQARVPHFVMAPECPGSTWGGMMGAGTELSQECRAVIQAIEALKKEYSLDTTRFIIGGFSLGGAGTYHMIQFLPDYWAAACPVGAGGSADAIDVISETPIWHHQGSNDNGGAALCDLGFGHGCWSSAVGSIDRPEPGSSFYVQSPSRNPVRLPRARHRDHRAVEQNRRQAPVFPHLRQRRGGARSAIAPPIFDLNMIWIWYFICYFSINISCSF